MVSILTAVGRGFAVLSSVAVASELVYSIWSYCCSRHDDQCLKNTKNQVHETIMFRQHEEGNNLKKSKLSRCLISPQLERIMFHLSSARHTLDCALYIITSVEIANMLISLLRCGVKVRCVVDADMAYSTGSQVLRLEQAGALIRWKKSSNLMHHKFCLIDVGADPKRCVPKLLTGSLNWTTQAMNGNWENVLVTSQDRLIADYKEEFDRLWREFAVNVKPVQ